MNILAVSGSLRAGGTNTAVLEAVRLLAPSGVHVEVYAGVATLPAFNPDRDSIDGGDALLPAEARAWRARVGAADALIISSPEYAHGVPGALKNALDWLVGSTEFPGKPVALLSLSSRSVHAQAQLIEVLTTMSARLVGDPPILVPLPNGSVDARAVVESQDARVVVRAMLASLVSAVAARWAGGSSSISSPSAVRRDRSSTASRSG